MNLESIPKFHAPKTQQFTDAPRATASDALTGTDVLGAIGMAQSRAPLGFSAFSGKMNLSENDKKKAIQLLMQYGLKHCGKVAALRKLETNVRGKVAKTATALAGHVIGRKRNQQGYSLKRIATDALAMATLSCQHQRLTRGYPLQ